MDTLMFAACSDTCELPSAGACSCANRPAHVCGCICAWLPHLENLPFLIRPGVLTTCTLGCVGTQAHSLLGHLDPNSY